MVVSKHILTFANDKVKRVTTPTQHRRKFNSKILKMKLYGITGFGTGKLGNSVYSVRNGEQIVRQYNPVVANPQTDAQVQSRTILKLMSQLAAILAPVIAIPASGLKSKRNLFISQNYNLAYYSNNEAQIALDSVQLTKSSIAFPSVDVERAQATGITCELASDSHLSFDRVVYVCLVKQTDGSMSLYDTKVISEAGQNGTFPGVLAYTPNAICIYAYGIRANDEATLTRFDNILADSGMNIAAVANRSRDLLANVTYSITRGLVLAAGENSGTSGTDTVQITLSANPESGGTVSGGGRVTLGSSVTVTATEENGYAFSGWFNGSTKVSESRSYTFVANEPLALVGKFVYAGD